MLLHHCPTISPPGDFSRGIPFCCLFFSFVVCLYFFLLVVFSVFDLQCDHSKPSVPWGFLEEFAYFHLLDVVVLCLLLLFPSFDVVVCLPIVPCSAKYFLFFMLSVSCCFSLWSWCLHISRCCWWCLFFRFLFFCVFQVGSRQGGRRGRICTLFLVFFGRSCFAMFFLCFFHLFFLFFFLVFVFVFKLFFFFFGTRGGEKWRPFPVFPVSSRFRPLTRGLFRCIFRRHRFPRGFPLLACSQQIGGTLGKVSKGMWPKPKEYECGSLQTIAILEDFHCWHVHSR